LRQEVLKTMSQQTVLTPEQICEEFQVPPEAVKEAIASGRLRAFDFEGHQRILRLDLDAFIADAFAVASHNNGESKQPSSFQFNPIADFTHTWPDGKTEHFGEAREGVVSYAGREYRIRLGYTVRKAAGLSRRRCLILVDRYPTVEFVGADERTSGKLASVIKDRAGKQLPVGGTVPPEYKGMPIGPYRDVVEGNGSSNGLAVICDQRDFRTMALHALIRYKFRKDRS
jgi:hypothetical protein